MGVIHEEGDFECDTGIDGKPIWEANTVVSV